MKSVSILPTLAFANGQRVSATQINVISIQDNLFDYVLFKYTLLDENGAWAGESTFELKGEKEYQTWDTSPEGAYNIVANGIGVTIVKENKLLTFNTVE